MAFGALTTVFSGSHGNSLESETPERANRRRGYEIFRYLMFQTGDILAFLTNFSKRHC